MKRFQYLDRRNPGERNRLLELKFLPGGETQNIHLNLYDDYEVFDIGDIKARQVIVTIKDVYGVMNNGGSFGFIGSKCEVLEKEDFYNINILRSVDERYLQNKIPDPLFQKLNRHALISLNCRDSISNTNKFDDIVVKPGTKIDIICPESCINTEAPVYGSNIYSKDSALCRSAFHAGAITSYGGKVTINIEDTIDNYTSSLSRGIKSDGRAFSEFSVTFENYEKEDTIILKPGSKIDYYNSDGVKPSFEKAIITTVNETPKGKILNMIIEGSN